MDYTTYGTIIQIWLWCILHNPVKQFYLFGNHENETCEIILKRGWYWKIYFIPEQRLYWILTIYPLISSEYSLICKFIF